MELTKKLISDTKNVKSVNTNNTLFCELFEDLLYEWISKSFVPKQFHFLYLFKNAEL